MKRLASLLLVATIDCAGPASTAVAQDTPFARVSASFARADVPATEAAARDVLASDTVTEHRRAAFVMLGNLAWRIRRDSTAAFDYHRQAVAIAARRALSLSQRARGELSFGNYAAARADARAARDAATTVNERAQATLTEARAVIDPMFEQRADTAGIGAVVRDLRAFVRDAPGEINSAQLLINAAAFAHDGPAMRAGWHSYYLALTNDGTTNVLAGPRDTLDRVLPQWTPASDSPETRRTIVHALADSRFFEAAAWLAQERLADGRSISTSDARAKDIVTYAGFLREGRRITNEFYRLTALKNANEREWQEGLRNAAQTAWSGFAWKGSPPSFDWSVFLREVGTRFGAVSTGFGSTANFKDIHYGHSVDDERHAVTQYGHTAAFHFVQLDQMLSNGFLSWFWDGGSSDGGWQNSEMVVQVRPAYASGPIQSWVSRTDTAQRRINDIATAVDSVSDIARARATPVAFLPSVGRRLARAGEAALYDSLTATGLTGEALRARFVQILGEEIQEYSIFQHEGRHAIDADIYAKSPLVSSELEFRAKLSQVAFAPRPQLAIGTIMGPNIGDKTPHGTANMRIMQGILAWMTDHAGEIAHLDRTVPLLPQLPLLTTEQLRAAFRSLDPLSH